MGNSVDPDQKQHSVVSDEGLHCLQRPSLPILRVITVDFALLEKVLLMCRTTSFCGEIRKMYFLVKKVPVSYADKEYLRQVFNRFPFVQNV